MTDQMTDQMAKTPDSKASEVNSECVSDKTKSMTPSELHAFENGKKWYMNISQSEDESLCKLFIGNIPKTATKDELVVYFTELNLKFRSLVLMMENAGTAPIGTSKDSQLNRGFGFITTTVCEEADKVIALSDRAKFQNKQLDIKRAAPKDVQDTLLHVNTPRIFLGGIPSTVTQQDILNYYNPRYENLGCVEEVILKYDKITNKLRGFCFVIFSSFHIVDKIMICDRKPLINGKLCDVRKADNNVPAKGLVNPNPTHTNNNFNSQNTQNKPGKQLFAPQHHAGKQTNRRHASSHGQQNQQNQQQQNQQQNQNQKNVDYSKMVPMAGYAPYYFPGQMMMPMPNPNANPNPNSNPKNPQSNFYLDPTAMAAAMAIQQQLYADPKNYAYYQQFYQQNMMMQRPNTNTNNSNNNGNLVSNADINSNDKKVITENSNVEKTVNKPNSSSEIFDSSKFMPGMYPPSSKNN